VTTAIRWGWSGALRGLLLAIPAMVVAVDDPARAALLALGVVPTACVPLPPRRRDRIQPAVLGILCGLALFVGGVLALWAPLAVVGIFGIAVLSSRIAAGRRLGVVALTLLLPLTGIGLSFSDVSTAAGLAVLISLGSIYALLVSLLWPAGAGTGAVAQPGPPPRGLILRFGYLAGTAGAVCAAVGFALDLEHVGWATGAALLVMRPAREAQESRSVGRVLDVLLGAATAIVLVHLDPPGWVYGVALAVVVAGATATVGSRWYVLPTFTTFLVFLMLLVNSPDDAASRFWERTLETVLGVGVAAVVGLLVPALLARPQTEE
jgi:hypothetical protein